MGAGASAHAETSESGGQQITKYGRYAVTMDNDKPIRVSRPDAVRRRTGRSDLTVYRSGAFTVEVIDGDSDLASASASNPPSRSVPTSAAASASASASDSASASASASVPSAKDTAAAGGTEFQTPEESQISSADCSAEALSALGVKQLKRELALRQINCAGCIEKSQLIAKLLERLKVEFSGST